MNKFIKTLGISLGLAFLIAILIPQEKIDGLKASWARLFGDPPQLCLDYEKGSLKDPDSAILLDSKANGLRVSIDYKARNSYGAYTKSTAVCAVIDGKIDEMGTLRLRALEEASAGLDCQIRRNERALELMRKGRSKAEAWSQYDCPAVDLDEFAEPQVPAAAVAVAPAAEAAPAAAAVPAAGAGEALYKQACSVCHAAGVAGAPKFGDKAAWSARVGLGLDGLTTSAIKGKGAMPPKGGSTASDADIKAAVEYMLAAVK